MQPETQFVRCGKLHIAYQVIGDGEMDLIYVPGWVSHIELAWEEPTLARFLRRLASFSRLITFDKRGTGLSDRVSEEALPTLEERMDDLKCVMDVVGSEKAALFGFSEGGNLCAQFAATYPDRVRGLVLFGVFAKRIWSEDYPWAPKPKDREAEYAHLEREWGNTMDLDKYIPSKIHDEAFVKRLATYLRRAASPNAAVTLLKMNTQIDIRSILPLIKTPTLVMNRTGDLEAMVAEGRWIADQIPNGIFKEMVGADHLPWIGDQDSVLDEIEEFLTGVKPTSDFDRVLATILFTDIVGSTELAAKLGDTAWRSLLLKHNSILRDEILRGRGQEIETAGDGFVVTFDGPLRAIRCANRMISTCNSIGISLRIGMHTGEIHKLGTDISGLAVHIAARVMGLAKPDEIVITKETKDISSSPDVAFVSTGRHTLKGVPGEWELFSAVVTA